MTDNFRKGKTGNLVAAINLQDGRIVRAVGVSGESINEVAHHPETGKALVGERLPRWEEICELCIRASEALPGLAFQHWDVVLTDEGPQLLEVNICGDVVLHQVAHQTGIYDSSLAAASRQAKRHRETMEAAKAQFSGHAKPKFWKFRLR